MSAILASLLPTLLTALVPIITGLLAWVASSIAKRNATATAATRLGVIGAALLQRGWEHIGPEIQQGLADGKWDPADATTIEASVKEIIFDVVDEATLTEIGKALGLPLAGVIAKVSSWLISKWTQAHDADIPTVSSAQFPSPAMLQPAGGAPDPTAG